MPTDAYPPIYTREQGQYYLLGWRDRRDSTIANPPSPITASQPYIRGWMEADAAIRLGRNIGQLTPRE